jgi:predicted small secreted protein
MAAGACLLIVAGSTTSCSTAKGFGKDVEKTGDHIQNAASR